MEWSAERPRVSGIYAFMDDGDTLAEEISTLRVDVDSGTVVPEYEPGTTPVPLGELRGHWLGPMPAPDERGAL